jgi:ABC-type phosphate transport system substrate-binding protein
VGDNQGRIVSAEEDRMRVFRRKSLAKLLLLAALACVLWAPVASAKDLAIISNKENALQTISLAELVKVCKGETHSWPDGRPVTFIMRDPQAPEMKLVLQKLYELRPEEVKDVITAANHGRMNHPAIVVVKSDEEVVAKVQAIPGAVGVVDVYSITGAVVVVKVAGKNPFEPGYVLHGN